MTLLLLPDGTYMLVVETDGAFEEVRVAFEQFRAKYPDHPPIIVLRGPVKIEDLRR